MFNAKRKKKWSLFEYLSKILKCYYLIANRRMVLVAGSMYSSSGFGSTREQEPRLGPASSIVFPSLRSADGQNARPGREWPVSVACKDVFCCP